ncbi:hypothetical protein SLEP1_g2627 [Rubroshorea leprosula]|uniref:VLRF1 domain-containing protein n=1 Tax=Rubroshorea leprosula TaxID=152421 RepID=A0AAV5HRY6_9ROSI|nr:hypothetical protein SLEP1_g2627 [Rubroshorea leprosula]
METEAPPVATTSAAASSQERRYRSIFDLPDDFFDSCRLLSPSLLTPVFECLSISEKSAPENIDEIGKEEEKASSHGISLTRWTCNTCKADFDSLQDQRSHFKSDIHRFNVKLSIAGKAVVKEEDFDELTSDSFKDYEVSSISGSEDELDKGASSRNEAQSRTIENIRKKLFIHLQTGERVSVWKSLVLSESENVSYENEKEASAIGGRCLSECEVIERLRTSVQETRDGKHLRAVLLASGGHFAGCVFDGNSVVAHKTFHRYVVRAKAGKKQSSKDASGKAAHSAGASLRRYNELALKKEIQELLSAWKPYFDAASCVFIYAPSNNRQMLFNGDKPYFSNQYCAIRNVPLSVRRPTFKEARRIYNQLTQVAYEVEEENPTCSKEDVFLSGSNSSNDCPGTTKEELGHNLTHVETNEGPSNYTNYDKISSESESETEGVCITTPLHEAAQSGNVTKVLELLEQGLDPCIKDERGQTPYMLASEKEVRNSFRRFMASNLDKWDWHAAKVPSALTKEMEESQAAKQAEKDAKKKARAKELKKLRRAKEKKAQAQAVQSENAVPVAENKAPITSVLKAQSSTMGRSQISKEEELKRTQAAEREKRAAAAESRIAAVAAQNTQGSSPTVTPTTSQSRTGIASDINCSCCNSSLAGKVPFHRYNYKYCSTSCMHVHREILEDG